MEMDLLPESWLNESLRSAFSEDELFYSLREMDVSEALLLCHKIEGKARVGSISLEEVFGELLIPAFNQSIAHLIPSCIETMAAKHKKRRGLVYLLGFYHSLAHLGLSQHSFVSSFVHSFIIFFSHTLPHTYTHTHNTARIPKIFRIRDRGGRRTR